MFLRGMVRRLAEKKARELAMPKSPKRSSSSSKGKDDGDHGLKRRHGRGGRSMAKCRSGPPAKEPRCGPRVYAEG